MQPIQHHSFTFWVSHRFHGMAAPVAEVQTASSNEIRVGDNWAMEPQDVPFVSTATLADRSRTFGSPTSQGDFFDYRVDDTSHIVANLSSNFGDVLVGAVIHLPCLAETGAEDTPSRVGVTHGFCFQEAICCSPVVTRSLPSAVQVGSTSTWELTAHFHICAASGPCFWMQRTPQ